MGSTKPDPRLRHVPQAVTALPPRAVYALRAMVVLANLAPGESVNSQDLAAGSSIPPAFVSKIMRRLVESGLVDSRRGHGGGFRLAVPPASVTIARILAAVDVSMESTQCVFGFRACDAGQPCALHDAWSRLKDTLSDWANRMTLADTRP